MGITVSVTSFASSKYLLAFSGDAPSVPSVSMPGAKHASSSICIIIQKIYQVRLFFPLLYINSNMNPWEGPKITWQSLAWSSNPNMFFQWPQAQAVSVIVEMKTGGKNN